MFNISSYLEKCKVKPGWDITATLSRVHKSENTISIAAEDLEKKDFSYIAGEDVKWYSLLENI